MNTNDTLGGIKSVGLGSGVNLAGLVTAAAFFFEQVSTGGDLKVESGLALVALIITFVGQRAWQQVGKYRGAVEGVFPNGIPGGEPLGVGGVDEAPGAPVVANLREELTPDDGEG